MGNITSYTYDAYGNRTSQTINGNTTYFGYDSSGNLTSITDPEGNTVQFSYNVMGWRVSRTDALSRVTNYAYDDLGRLVQITYPDGSVVSFSYDAGEHGSDAGWDRGDKLGLRWKGGEVAREQKRFQHLLQLQ